VPQAIPASLKRYGLSQIINHLLGLGEMHRWAGRTRPSRRWTSQPAHGDGAPPSPRISNTPAPAEPARPFDFIVNGELVRKSLDKHLLEHNISPEAVVEVEYVPAIAPPEPKASIPHDDW
jgi:ribosome biogenesis protein YTM1